MLDSLHAHAPALKARLSPDAPFGIGLRLSGDESRELLADGRLDEFRAWLDSEGLYVFTINGFPHGTFHGQPVKADVHAPDWRTEERVQYTLRLAEILAALLPGRRRRDDLHQPALLQRRGSTTTAVERARRTCGASPTSCAARGSRSRSSRRPTARSPTVDDVIRWWPDGLENVTVCFDACHSAVAYEEPEEALDALDEAGIRVGKAQLSAALHRAGGGARGAAGVRRPDLPAPGDRARRRTASWPDLPEALADDGGGEEWRVHFHVPIFVERYGRAASRRRTTSRGASGAVRTSHLEIETYTWDVLPAELKASSVDSIAREYEWVLDVLR